MGSRLAAVIPSFRGAVTAGHGAGSRAGSGINQGAAVPPGRLARLNGDRALRAAGRVLAARAVLRARDLTWPSRMA